MAETYGWTPDQVNKLTLYQVYLYTCDAAILGKRVAREPGDDSNRQQRQQEKHDAIDRIMRRYEGS